MKRWFEHITYSVRNKTSIARRTHKSWHFARESSEESPFLSLAHANHQKSWLKRVQGMWNLEEKKVGEMTRSDGDRPMGMKWARRNMGCPRFTRARACYALVPDGNEHHDERTLMFRNSWWRSLKKSKLSWEGDRLTQLLGWWSTHGATLVERWRSQGERAARQLRFCAHGFRRRWHRTASFL